MTIIEAEGEVISSDYTTVALFLENAGPNHTADA